MAGDLKPSCRQNGFPGQVDCEVDHNQLENAIAQTYAKFHQPCPTFITAISRQPGDN